MYTPHLHLFLVFPMCLRPAVGPIKTFVSPIEVTRHRPCYPRGCSFAVGRSPPSPAACQGVSSGHSPPAGLEPPFPAERCGQLAPHGSSTCLSHHGKVPAPPASSSVLVYKHLIPKAV